MKILTFFAHPDDETILAGGTLALLARAGAQVDYLCATRGEGGETGEPPLCTQEQLGEVRSREMTCAVRALGGHSLAFLPYADPLVGEGETLYPYTDDFDTLVAQLQDILTQHKPDAVITHGSNGEYGHPAHLLSYRAMRAAVESAGANAPLLYAASADFPNHPKPRIANQENPAHLIVDVRPALDAKERAALCHRTQNALFVRRASREAGRKLTVRQVLTRQEGLHRLLPPMDEPAKDPLVQLLRPWLIYPSQ